MHCRTCICWSTWHRQTHSVGHTPWYTYSWMSSGSCSRRMQPVFKKKRALNQSWVRKVTLGGPTHPLISPLTAHKQMLRKSPGTGQDAVEHCLQPSRACVTTVNDAAGSLTTTWTWTEYCPACWNYHQMKMAISPNNICGKCCSGSWVSQDFERLDHNVISKDLYRNCFKERKDGE